MLSARIRAARHQERGVVAVLVALCMVCLCLSAAVALEFGMVRMDRQMAKSATDSAVAAGLRASDGGTGAAFNSRAVCAAVDYLRSNRSGLETLPACSVNSTRTCAPGDHTTDSSYSATVTSGGKTFEVWVKMPYVVGETLGGGAFPEETRPTLTGDAGDPTKQGCDQLAVIIRQSNQLGLGRVIRDAPIVTRVRSVGRVVTGDRGNAAVVLLLLERTDCQAVQTEGSGAGVFVGGSGDVPGLIHSDSLGTGPSCSTTAKIFDGNHTGGIVADQAPTGNPRAAGVIGSVALSGAAGANPANVSDAPPFVRAVGSPGELPVGRSLLTRRPVDNQFRAGVQTVMAQAVSAWNTPNPSLLGLVQGAQCLEGGFPLTAALVTGTVYFNCPTVDYNSDVTLQAKRVIFSGALSVRSNKKFSMPRATEVFINKPGGASVGLLNKGTFEMHTNGASSCAASTATERARLVIGDGSFKSEGGSPVFRVCGTSVIMMGGSNTGCLPTVEAQAPLDTTPCDGNLAIAGGASTDWTAPDLRGADVSEPDRTDLEDLAFWTESHLSSELAGSGDLKLTGVFVLPNANPFNIGGNGAQNVANSQYVTRKLLVRGTGVLTMRPDPSDVIVMPYFQDFSLVR